MSKSRRVHLALTVSFDVVDAGKLFDYLKKEEISLGALARMLVTELMIKKGVFKNEDQQNGN